MAGHMTRSVDPAYSGARVSALVVNTGLISGTLWIYDTLWLALYVRVAYIIPNTPTRSGTTIFGTFCVNPAWRWTTRQNNLNRNRCGYKKKNVL